VSVWRHFERLQAFPRGLLSFGHAICRFNPGWGQGMTVAAQEAVLLPRLLGASAGDARALADLAPAFFTEACRAIETPWEQAAVPDFVIPDTEGERPPDFENQLRVGARSLGSRPRPRRAQARGRGTPADPGRAAICRRPIL
jgi:2-polyprenyl-6-methoxyphenol hydroxylase-like FAD-dependent oxidoreductase